MGTSKYALDYIDSMMVVDKNLKIIHSNRFSQRRNSHDMKNEYKEYIGKEFFEVYNPIDPEESTILECVQTGNIIVRDKQTFMNMSGIVYTTKNITYPIIRFGEIVGAIELSQDITSVGDLEKVRELNNARKETWNINQGKIKDGEITFENILTQDPSMLENIRQAKIFALDDNPVLIYGATGTGKEMFVEAMINANKARKNKFMIQNCAAIPENLFESILFGATRGSFTGAENKTGLFELADGGTLFLDEINSMPISQQAKLLRVLQDGKVRPIGSTLEKKVNVKVIAAMNQKPQKLIKDNALREDLFYRFSNSTLYLTALRDRKEDIPIYIKHFLKQFVEKYHKNILGLSDELENIFMRYNWPGNVRELRQVLESMVNISQDVILDTKCLPMYMKENLDMENDGIMELECFAEEDRDGVFKKTLKEMLEKTEREYILKALRLCKGNISKAAGLLEMPRQTLKFRMDKLQIRNCK